MGAVVTNVKSPATYLWVANVACLGDLRKYMPLYCDSLALLYAILCSSF